MSGKKTRLVDTQDVFNVLSDYYHHNSATQHLALQEALNKVPTVDAVPLDGSFLKMSRGDYLIYKRHWLYEHFDMEMDIQRSAMKSMGYEPALKDTKPQWIPCSERLPEEDTCFYLVTIANHGLNFTTTLPDDVDVVRWDYDRRKGHNSWHWCTERTVIAWMPLPKPYEVEE